MAQFPGEKALAITEAAGTSVDEDAVRRVAGAFGVARKTVREMLQRWAPVVEELKALKKDHLVALWQQFFFETFGEYDEAVKRGGLGWGDRQRAATALAIATDKLAVLEGRPSVIVGHVHAVRVDLHAIAEKLAAVEHGG